MTITKALLNETLDSLAETFNQIEKLDGEIADELENVSLRSNYRSAERQQWASDWLSNKQEELVDEVEGAIEGITHISHFFETLEILTKEEWKQLDGVFVNIINRLEGLK